MIASTRVRRMGIGFAAALLMGLLVCAGSGAQSPSGPVGGEVSKLRILYMGHPGSEREKDFVQFLGQHFATVQTADLGAFAGKAFTDQDAAGFDVTIFDYDGEGFKAPRTMAMPRFLDDDPRLARAGSDRWLTRPVLTVGVAGGLMASQWGLKTGYL